jgi:hypothetical protein
MAIAIIFLIVFAAFTSAQPACAGNATLLWRANTESDLAGYNIYYGTSSSAYTNVIDVGLTGSPDSPSYTINDLPGGQTYYFTVAAYDTFNNQSSISNEVSKYIPPTIPPNPLLPPDGGGGCGIWMKDTSSGSRQGRDKIPLDLLILTLLLFLSKVRKMLELWKI